MDSLRQRGQRLGLVKRLRSLNSNPQCWQDEGSSRNRRAASRLTVFTIWARWSSTWRSGMPTLCASWNDDNVVPVINCMIRCRDVSSVSPSIPESYVIRVYKKTPPDSHNLA
jgi:hypothetical protein